MVRENRWFNLTVNESNKVGSKLSKSLAVRFWQSSKINFHGEFLLSFIIFQTFPLHVFFLVASLNWAAYPWGKRQQTRPRYNLLARNKLPVKTNLKGGTKLTETICNKYLLLYSAPNCNDRNGKSYHFVLCHPAWVRGDLREEKRQTLCI